MLDKKFSVVVRKITDEELMRMACESTFLGKSHQTLMSIYKSEHSPTRTQLFWVTIKNAPLASCSQLVRHHVGVEKFMMTMRSDRSGLKDRCPFIAKRLRELLSTPEELRPKEHDDEVNSLLDELENKAGRNALTSLSILVNAQSLIDMAKVRLCLQASTDSRMIYQAIKEHIAKIDHDLAEMMVRKCVYRGGLCGEPKCCCYNMTESFREEFGKYSSHFSKKQRGLLADK